MNELERLQEWLLDENREPAKTKFTAGELRNVAQEFEVLELKNTQLNAIVQEVNSIIDDEKKQSMAKFFKEADEIFESKKERFQNMYDAFLDGWFCGLSKFMKRIEGAFLKK